MVKSLLPFWFLAATSTLAASPDLFLETELEPDRVVVQTEAVVRLRFYQGVDLREVKIVGPSAPLADFRPLGEGTVREGVREGRRYRVHERAYAVFPFASGPLEVAGARAEGRHPDGRRATIPAPARTLAVLPLPPDPVPVAGPIPREDAPRPEPVPFPFLPLAIAALLAGLGAAAWRRRAAIGTAWRLRRACGTGGPEAVRDALLAWAAARWPEPPPTLGALARLIGDEPARQALAELDRSLYGPAAQKPDASTLAGIVRRVKRRAGRRPTRRGWRRVAAGAAG